MTDAENNLTLFFKSYFYIIIVPARILRKVLAVEIYSHTVNIQKISICLNRGREESVGNDDVSIVCARKYEMVRMT